MSAAQDVPWKVFFASAAGKYHLDSDDPCQDAGHHIVTGDVLIGIVCDGAGSASQARRGSDFFAQALPALLSTALATGRLAIDVPAGHRDAIIGSVDAARSELAQIAAASQLELRDYACTLVGCLVSPRGGCLFHIGDGFAICEAAAEEAVLSRPENGDCTDETYFVTDDNWQEHLRLTPVPPIGPGGLLGLMSDGASPFAVNRERSGFYRPFIDPILAFLGRAGGHDGNQALQGVLEDERTFAITSDDKTLLLAMRP